MFYKLIWINFATMSHVSLRDEPNWSFCAINPILDWPTFLLSAFSEVDEEKCSIRLDATRFTFPKESHAMQILSSKLHHCCAYLL